MVARGGGGGELDEGAHGEIGRHARGGGGGELDGRAHGEICGHGNAPASYILGSSGNREARQGVIRDIMGPYYGLL